MSELSLSAKLQDEYSRQVQDVKRASLEQKILYEHRIAELAAKADERDAVAN